MTMSAKTLISFNYINCNLEELSNHEASFDEEVFKKELEKAEETQLTINSIIVELKKEPSHANGQYETLVMTKGPKIDLKIKFEGNDPAAITRTAIHETIKQIREQKEKNKHH